MHPGLAQNVLKNKGISMIYVSKNQKKAESKKSREAYLELELLASANRNKYENLLRELENRYLKGTEQYPKNVVSAYNLLVNWGKGPKELW